MEMKLAAYLTSAVWWRAGLFTLRGLPLKVCNYSCDSLLDGDLCPYIVHSLAGLLPSPENVTLISQNFSPTQLHWNPPYYTLNQGSAAIHVDPHVTQYTVYIFDAYTRRMIRSVNMTETSFTLPHNIPLCPMYRVSAWNAGGEGELSEPVQESTPQGKQVKDFLH